MSGEHFVRGRNVKQPSVACRVMYNNTFIGMEEGKGREVTDGWMLCSYINQSEMLVKYLKISGCFFF